MSSGLWWIFPILVLIMIVGCIFFMGGCSCLSRRRWSSGRGANLSADSAEDILSKRFALGEIDWKEYEEMKSRIAGEKQHQ